MDRPIVPRRSETAAETCLEWRKAPKKPKPEQRAKPTQNEKPLCAIASNAQTAIELLAVGDHEEAKHALQDIWSDARRGSEVIGRVRNMVKKQDARRLPTGLACIIEEVVPAN